MKILHRFFSGRKKRYSGFYKQHAESHARIRDLQLKKQSLMKKYESSGSEEKKRLQTEMNEIDKKISEELLQAHLYNDGFRKSDLRQYYRHIRVARPLSIAVDLLLLGLLFCFGGVSLTFRIVILVLAVIFILGSIFELTFLFRVKKRILSPVEDLKAGVKKIAEGNYDVKVENNTHSEIGTLIAAFNSMAQKLREDEKIKTEYEENRKALIANISHDLKTPMTSIEGYVEALLERDDLSDEKKARYLRIIAGNTEHMNHLIDDLFLFSKLDMQKLDFNFKQVSIRPFLSDMLKELELELEEQNISFGYICDLDHDAKAAIDGRRFHQIIWNIVSNAVKFGPQKGLCICIRLYEKDTEFLHINIADNGPGIPQEKLSNIFDRFYRVDSERGKNTPGTGLGLAIAKELTESHSGTISVVSNERTGTCFTVSIPEAASVQKNTGRKSS